MARTPQEYPPEFEAAWREYPHRPGHSKINAFKAWKARIKEGIAPEALLEGVREYARYCKLNRTEPAFIKHAATFFGPGHHFACDYKIPEPLSPEEQTLISFYQKEQLV